MRWHLLVVAGLVLAGFSRAGEATWFETRQRVEQLAESGRYDEAIGREDELLALVTAAFGEPSFELADAFLLMGSIHSRDGRYFEAEGRVLRALELIEEIEGPLSTKLIDPFVALGENYHRSEDYDLAVGAYNEARNLGRRAYGLFNRGQIPILEKMSDSVLGMGNYPEALELRREALWLLMREAAPGSLELLEANYRHARWLEGRSDYGAAYRHYLVMRQMILTQFGGDPRLLVPVLRLAAETLRTHAPRGNRAIAPGASELNEALRILEDLGNPDPRLRAEILLEIGDWQSAFDRTWLVEETYLAAWNALDDVENGDTLRREWFSGLTATYSAPLVSRYLTEAEDAPSGRVTATFTIDEDGRPDDFAVLESDPDGLLDRAARRQLLNSRYRPRMVDGRLVPSHGTMTWTFRYDD